MLAAASEAITPVTRCSLSLYLFSFPSGDEDETIIIPESFDEDLDNQQYSSPER
jgi:hypothetical protein